MADSTSDASAAPATEHDATLDQQIADSEKRLKRLQTRQDTLNREWAAERALNARLHADRGTTPTPPETEPVATPPSTTHVPAQAQSAEPVRGPRHRRHDDAGLDILDGPDESEESSPRHLTVNPRLEHRESHDDSSGDIDEEDAAQEHPEHQGPPLHHEEEEVGDSKKPGLRALPKRIHKWARHQRLRVRRFLDVTIRNEII